MTTDAEFSSAQEIAAANGVTLRRHDAKTAESLLGPSFRLCNGKAMRLAESIISPRQGLKAQQ